MLNADRWRNPDSTRGKADFAPARTELLMSDFYARV
jgi:hypothetical protein